MLVRLLRAVYFLVKHRIAHTTVFPDLLELLVVNGDEVLGRHFDECVRKKWRDIISARAE